MRRGSRGRRAGGGLKYVCTNSWVQKERQKERQKEIQKERQTERQK